MPVTQRADNVGATFLGIGAAFVVLFVVPSITTAMLARNANAAFDLLRTTGAPIDGALCLVLIVASIVLLVRNPRDSPYRAFAFASLITIIVALALIIIFVGGFLLVCYLIVNAAGHASK